MEFSFEQLRCFVTAAECGSFCGAARRLGKAQSAVSMAVALLEADLGVELFDRSGRSIRLTEEGRMLLLDALELLRQAEAMQERADFLAAGQVASLSVLFDGMLPEEAVSRLLAGFGERFPEMELHAGGGSGRSLLDAVSGGLADIAFQVSSEPLPTGLAEHHAGRLVRGLYAGADHPLAGRRTVQRRELARYRQIVIRSRDAASTCGIHSTSVWYVDSAPAAAALAARGAGWCILPCAAARREGKALRRIVCSSMIPAGLPVRMIWRTGRILGPAEHWLESTFANILAELSRNTEPAPKPS